ncbi:MAG: hypothetical protein J6C77_03660 [Muribaculaceae bacterium]|nr:hypothetical protein [Muribaculaceae bacterium]
MNLYSYTKALATVAIISYSATAAAQSNDSINVSLQSNLTPRLVLRQADGRFPSTTSLDDTNSIPLILTDNGYVAEGVEITTGGFMFYGAGYDALTQSWSMHYLTLPDWAEQPLLMRYLNPLDKINSYNETQTRYMSIESGTYNIHYFTRQLQTDGSSPMQYYEMFSIVDSSDPGRRVQPRALYLVNSNGDAVTIEAGDTDGEYNSLVTLPEAPFKVTYQSDGYHMPAFIFGPKDVADVIVTSGREYGLIYGYNTATPFTLTDAAPASGNERLAAGTQADVKIVLDGNNTAITITRHTPAAIESVADDEASLPATYYTISGLRLSGEPTDAGIYIRRTSAGAKVIRR